MKLSCRRKAFRIINCLATVILIAMVAFALCKICNLNKQQEKLQNTVLEMQKQLYYQKHDTAYMVQELEASYNLSDQVSTSLGIITAGITLYTIFGGMLSVFSIIRSKELEDAISKAEKALENQKELNGARWLQDGLVYASRERPYYAVNAFEKVIKQTPDTTAALTARFEILLLYADTENTQIDFYRRRMVHKIFEKLLADLSKTNSSIDSDVRKHLHGDACFVLGCFYGECAPIFDYGINDLKVAECFLQMALKDNYADVEYHKGLAYTYALAGKTDHCIKELQTAIDCAEREPLYKTQVSQTRLKALFGPIWDTLSEDVQKKLNGIS